jgi:hypothetical protein
MAFFNTVQRVSLKMERQGQQINIKGIIIPAAWDAEGNATKAAISAFNEEEYLIEENGEGKRLLSLMQKVVEVSGVMRQEAGNKILKVEKFQQTTQESDG